MHETRNHQHGPGQFVGSAVIAGASYGHRATLLHLRTFAGEDLDFAIADTPDSAGAARLRSSIHRPLSVKIEHGGERCSVIALTPSGPRRWTVTLGTALALHQSGVHAVVDGGLRNRVACPTTRGR